MSTKAPRFLLGLIGDPARHSLSPLLHRAAYRALGLEWSYESFEVPAARFAAAVTGASALGFRGLSVTMPHKEHAALVSTRCSPLVDRLRAANTLSFEGAETLAESTDGAGFIDDLTLEAGFDPAGRSCGVIGAGGAGRAVVLALFEAGAAEILVVNRTMERALEAVALAPGTARTAPPEALASCDLVVNATPLTMEDAEVEGGSVLALARPGAGQMVVDLAYHPPANPFLESAAARGSTTRNGLGVLVHQAAAQVRLWTGEAPPLEAMWSALSEHLRPGPEEPPHLGRAGRPPPRCPGGGARPIEPT